MTVLGRWFWWPRRFVSNPEALRHLNATDPLAAG
jgi:hypothetical protein